MRRSNVAVASYFAAFSTLGPSSIRKSVRPPTARRDGSLASARTADPVRAKVAFGHRRFTSTFAPSVDVPEFPLVITKLRPLLEYQPGGAGAAAAAATVAAQGLEGGGGRGIGRGRESALARSLAAWPARARRHARRARREEQPRRPLRLHHRAPGLGQHDHRPLVRGEVHPARGHAPAEHA